MSTFLQSFYTNAFRKRTRETYRGGQENGCKKWELLLKNIFQDQIMNQLFDKNTVLHRIYPFSSAKSLRHGYLIKNRFFMPARTSRACIIYYFDKIENYVTMPFQDISRQAGVEKFPYFQLCLGEYKTILKTYRTTPERHTANIRRHGKATVDCTSDLL